MAMLDDWLFAPAAAANASGIPVGTMPILDGTAAFSMAGPPPAAPPPAPVSLPDRLNEGLANNSHLLTLLGAGLLGGRSLGEALSLALRGASEGAQLDRKLAAQNQTAAFLSKRIPGLSDAEALGMAQDPKVMAALLRQMLGVKNGPVVSVLPGGVLPAPNTPGIGPVDAVASRSNYDRRPDEPNAGAPAENAIP